MDPCRPNWPYTLERDSPQARGLRWWWPGPETLNAGAVQLREMIRGAHMTMSSAVVTEAKHPVLGRAFRFGVGYMSRMYVALTGSTGAQAITCWVVPTTIRVTQAVILDSYSANGVRLEMRYDGSSAGIFRGYYQTTASAWGVGADASPVTADTPYHLGLVLANGGYTLYVNGRWRSSIGAGIVAVNQGGYTLGDYRGGGVAFEGLVADLRVYWGSKEHDGNDGQYAPLMRALYDPRTRWDLYGQLSRKMFFLPPLESSSVSVRRTLYGRSGARRG